MIVSEENVFTTFYSHVVWQNTTHSWSACVCEREHWRWLYVTDLGNLCRASGERFLKTHVLWTGLFVNARGRGTRVFTDSIVCIEMMEIDQQHGQGCCIEHRARLEDPRQRWVDANLRTQRQSINWCYLIWKTHISPFIVMPAIMNCRTVQKRVRLKQCEETKNVLVSVDTVPLKCWILDIVAKSEETIAMPQCTSFMQKREKEKHKRACFRKRVSGWWIAVVVIKGSITKLRR